MTQTVHETLSLPVPIGAFLRLPINQSPLVFSLKLCAFEIQPRQDFDINSFCDRFDGEWFWHPEYIESVRPGALGAGTLVHAPILYSLPCTHETTVLDESISPDVRRLALQFLCFMLDCPAYTSNTSFDHPVRFWNTLDVQVPRDDELVGIVNNAFKVWRNWCPNALTRASNALWLHQRATSVSIEAMDFWLRYTALEALYDCKRLSDPKSKLGCRPKHAKKLDLLCKAVDVPTDSSALKTINKLRNNLVHEAGWPSFTRDSEVVSLYLRRITNRCLMRLAGIDNQYVRSDWWLDSRARMMYR